MRYSPIAEKHADLFPSMPIVLWQYRSLDGGEYSRTLIYGGRLIDPANRIDSRLSGRKWLQGLRMR